MTSSSDTSKTSSMCCVWQNGDHHKAGAGAQEASEGALADVAKAFNAVSVSDALGVVASAVPRIIPHVLINKREGVCSACCGCV